MRVGSAEMIALESTSSVKRCSKFPGNSPYPDAPDGAQCRSMLRGIDIRAVVDHAERAVILPWFWWSRQGWAQSPDGHVSVSYTHLRAHETDSYLVCRLL